MSREIFLKKPAQPCYGALNWDGKSPSTFHCPECAFTSAGMRYFPHERVEHTNRRSTDGSRENV